MKRNLYMTLMVPAPNATIKENIWSPFNIICSVAANDYLVECLIIFVLDFNETNIVNGFHYQLEDGCLVWVLHLIWSIVQI